MCGIAGFIDFDRRDAPRHAPIAENMASALRHRGPDDAGAYIDEAAGVALAHRRLSVLDLSSAARQPMESESGRFVLAYNGEIYNFQELRDVLLKTGTSFRTTSDTEVLLAAIEHWGISGALSRCSGMFAFALWDKSHRQLHLARDRMGEKPLYYCFDGRHFIFASELKALRAHPAWSPSIDEYALALHMRYGYIPDPYSIYKDTYKLSPGCTLQINAADARSAAVCPHPDELGMNRPQRYWSLDKVRETNARNPTISAEESAEELLHLLHETVRRQLLSDVPVGAFLSGGIDSSIVVAIMQAESATPVNTFTIGFEEAEFDEAPQAARIARHLGTDHTEVYISAQDALDLVPNLPRMFDEPFSDPSAIPTYLVSRLARSKVTVCLSGDGGDELFCGYNRYLFPEHFLHRLRHVPQWARRWSGSALLKLPPWFYDSASRLRYGAKESIPAAHRRLGHKIHKAAAILASESLPSTYDRLLSYWDASTHVVNNVAQPPAFAEWESGEEDMRFLDRVMLLDQKTYLPGDNLTKVDRASMATSLETRLPLLDHRVVEFAWRIPSTVKAQDRKGKLPLRLALSRHLPIELFERPKMGFSVPVGEWLRGPLRDWGESLLSQNALRQAGFLSVDSVRKRWAEHQTGRADHDLALWSVLMFQAWLEEFNGR